MCPKCDTVFFCYTTACFKRLFHVCPTFSNDGKQQMGKRTRNEIMKNETVQPRGRDGGRGKAEDALTMVDCPEVNCRN